MPSAPGRPTKLTAVLSARILEAIETGVGRDAAARAVGVDRSTLREWVTRGEAAQSGIYRTFYEGMDVAEARLQMKAVGIVHSLLDSDDERVRLKAATLILTHRFSQDWSTRREQVLVGKDGGAVQVAAEVKAEVAGKDGGPIQVEVKPRHPWSDQEVQEMSPEQLEQAVRLALRMSDAGQLRLDTLFTEEQLRGLTADQLLAVTRAAVGDA